MKFGILGTGMVGEAIGSKLVGLGHEVTMGSRDADNPKGLAWVERAGPRAHSGTFEDAAWFGEVVFNCTRGAASLDALRAAGEGNLAGKVLIDIANVIPMDRTAALSLGEQIQAAFPSAKVVKTLNTVTADVMVDPITVAGAHTVFVSGNDVGAKESVRALLRSFGWQDIVDLGDISTAQATEAYLALWLALWKVLGSDEFNVQVVR